MAKKLKIFNKGENRVVLIVKNSKGRVIDAEIVEILPRKTVELDAPIARKIAQLSPDIELLGAVE